jgi:hypothetical protein
LDGRGVFEVVDVEGMGNEWPGHEETEKGTQGTSVKSENKVEVPGKKNGEYRWWTIVDQRPFIITHPHLCVCVHFYECICIMLQFIFLL